MEPSQRKRQQKSKSASPSKSKGKALDFAYALRSFVGYLEGTEKSAHTIKNYQSDLHTFREFLEKGLGSVPVALAKVTREDLEKYHEYLKAQGLKTNTRRRKLLTVRRLLKYLTVRKKITIDVGRKLPAPHKVERIPMIARSADLIEAISKLPIESELQARNQVLLWTLAETGCQVSEVTRLRFENWVKTEDGSLQVLFAGKSPRAIPVSRELFEAVMALRERTNAKDPRSPWLFLGFNKFGSLGSPITPRGVEMLVKSYASHLGLSALTPRTFRHSVVLHWFEFGIPRLDIQKRLGLKTDYAFRVYDPILNEAKSRKKAASTSETTPPAP